MRLNMAQIPIVTLLVASSLALAATQSVASNAASSPASQPSAPATIQMCGPKPADYPPESVKANEQGASRVSFTVGADGQLKAVSIIKSSGYPRLDDAALKFLSSCKFRPARDRSNNQVEATFTVEYVWRLPN